VRIEIEVDNVKCGGCVTAIRQGLGELPGVDAVEVDIATGRVSIEAERDLGAELAQALRQLGYPPRQG
jgi:copper chaperone